MKNIDLKRILLSLLIVLCSKTVLAEMHHYRNMVATISAGSAWYTGGQTQTIYLQPGFANTYAVDSQSQALASGDLFLGIQRSINPAFLVQLGIVAATTSDANLQGSIWETGDAIFDNFSYQYHIRHTHVGIKTKLLTMHFSQTILPYFSASVAGGFNNAYDFKTSPKIFEAVPSPSFTSHTQTTFTYTLGLGLQKILSAHWQAGIGYEFSDWGKSSLSRAAGQNIGNGVSLNHLYTNQLQLGLSYLS